MTWVAAGHALGVNAMSAYLFFKVRPSSNFVRNPLTWVMFYVHRYLRLTPPMMIFIGFFTVVIPLTTGPWTASGKTGVFFDEFYQKPWTRCTPYLIGLGVGYLLAQFKNRKPKLHWVLVVAAWIIATSVGLLSVFGPHDYINGHDNWSKFVRATYNNFSRIGWSLAVSWVIAANHLGWGGDSIFFR
ncbi:hypothetical protein TELCIR_03297 [Teladorsagia circumcincta]|uniref:Acyltransferase 3 domain-containing protein n=1 Tax=Teladorsagia circumcincta TaxID=45464 RepID=A0A2G9UWT4_TELCI|nr:hypothetical protein TELCIR_03297 [Teladorsagia circumcincta]